MNSRRLALPLVAFACLVVAPLAGAVSQTQTSWTGGPGVAGPVSTWGTSFSSSAYIEYTTYPGQLFLDQVILGTPVQHTVRTNLNSLRWTWGADIDMDGGQDLIAAVSGTDDIIWWENYDDSGDTWIDHLVDGSFDGACCVMAADIDDDGDTDLFGAASVADDVAWWRHDGSSWTKIQVEGSFDGAWTVYAADIDRDSDLDIVGAARNADDVCWFENIGGMGASWVEHTIDGSFDGASHVVCADVDSDGDKDVVCAAEFGDMISWWSNNGSGTSWSERVVATGFEGASCVQAVDMDGDGDIDILGCARESDELAWFRNDNGYGTSWSTLTIEAGLAGVRSAGAADLDDDGDMDVAACVYDSDQILWWQNMNGVGTSWDRSTVHGDFDGAYTICCSDMDGDGVSDIVCSGELENANAWWQLTGFAPSGELVSSILDTGAAPDWGTFNYSAIVVPGTGPRFQARSSDNYGNMGPWSAYFSTSGFDLGTILVDGTRYFQYKVALFSNDPHGSPILESITVSWNLVGCSGEAVEVPGAPGISGISPNPSHGVCSISFRVNAADRVLLQIFDLSGRLVETAVDERFQEGAYSVAAGSLLPGVYACRMITGSGQTYSAMLAVVE